MRIAIACGGTGGHLFPGIAVGEALRGRGHEVMLIVSEKKIDETAVAGRESEFRIERQSAVGLPSPILSTKLLRFASGLFESVASARRLFGEFEPDAVLGMGGFTSTAPILAARLRRVPCFVHESNAIPGKANRLNARLARVVLLGFGECAAHFPAVVRCVVTGTPVRASLRQPVDRTVALQRFGFADEPGIFTLLAMGGSQGARGVNDAVRSALPALQVGGTRMRIIHQTGSPENAGLETAYREAGIPAYVAPFLTDMQDAYALADLAVSRSGAASLTEFSHFGLPSVLIPYPFAAEDHQTLNAQIFVAAGAAHILKESGIAEYLPRLLIELLRNREKLAALAAAARRLAPVDAAATIADTILAPAP